MRAAALVVALVVAGVAAPVHAEWAKPVTPVVAGASGYVAIPGAAVMPEKTRTYKAVYDGTRAAAKPSEILPVLDMAGSELNLFGATGVPLDQVKFVVVFHGAALDALLDDAHYRARYGVANPNLPVLADMKKAGVQLFVCGQNLAFEDRDPRALTKDVTVASDALVVLMTYQQDGYSLLSF